MDSSLAKANRKESAIQRRSRWSWYFYDFGNSAYASVILLAVYSVYFKDAVVGNNAEGTRLWGISVGIAAVAVAVISPVLGAIADFTRFKKKFLFVFTTLSVVFTALLFFVGKGDVLTGMLFFILAEIGYRGAQVFYDALLGDVSTPENIGSVSGKGWAVGMVGGVVALLVVLAPMQLMENFNISYAFLITAAFFTLSAIPTFLWVKETQIAEQMPEGEKIVFYAFKSIGKTFRAVKSYKEFIKYVVAFLFYNDGIMILMDFAGIIGGTLFGLEMTQLIILVVIIQISGALGALLFGALADKRSGKRSVLISLLMLMIVVSALFVISSIEGFYVAGYFVSSTIAFFIVGALAGLFLSGVQAVSRGIVVQMAPPEKLAEFTGFLSVSGRTSTFVGPLVFGTLAHWMEGWYVDKGFGTEQAEKYGLLWGVGVILAFLFVGGFILLFVKQAKAKETVEDAPAEETTV